MRNLLFAFIAFLLAVVCYADPPPEPANLIAEVDSYVDCQSLTAIAVPNPFLTDE